MWGGQRIILGCHLPPCTMWIPGTELRWSGLGVDSLTCRATLALLLLSQGEPHQQLLDSVNWDPRSATPKPSDFGHLTS